MNFKWVKIESVDNTILREFDCGNYAFNYFLTEKAEIWNNKGEAVTYLCVDSEECERHDINRVYGFATINTMGLLYENDNDEQQYLPCVELRVFAIAKQLRKNKDITKRWSKLILNTFLQELYFMSMNTVGFKAVFLNSNHDGYELYTEIGFSEIKDYVTPDADDKIDTKECTPLLLIMTEDTIGDLFVLDG